MHSGNVYNKQEEPSAVLASDEESNVIVDFVRTSQRRHGIAMKRAEVVVYNRQGKEAEVATNAVSLSNKQEEPSVVLVC